MKLFFAPLTFVLLSYRVTATRIGGPGTDSQDDLYVISYPRSLSLEDLVDVLDEAEIHVERQLSCTRGMLVRISNEEDNNMLNSIQGIKVLPYSSTHVASTHNDRKTRENKKGNNGNNSNNNNNNNTNSKNPNNPVPKNSVCICENFDEPDKFSKNEVNFIWEYIQDEIERDARCFDGSKMDCAGALLRNAFHDAAPFNGSDKALSGANGCVDLSHPGNLGLASANGFLKSVQQMVSKKLGKEISMADLIAIGGSAAVKATGGPSIQVNLGRRDISCECEETVLPPAESPKDAETIVAVLANQLNLNQGDMSPSWDRTPLDAWILRMLALQERGSPRRMPPCLPTRITGVCFVFPGSRFSVARLTG